MNKITVSFKWYDLWIGAYYDQKKRRVYICPLPCVVVAFEWPKSSRYSRFTDELVRLGISEIDSIIVADLIVEITKGNIFISFRELASVILLELYKGAAFDYVAGFLQNWANREKANKVVK